jgi:hypothetical protein
MWLAGPSDDEEVQHRERNSVVMLTSRKKALEPKTEKKGKFVMFATQHVPTGK